jgi:hypothetical protein
MRKVQVFKATGDIVIVPRKEYVATISYSEKEEDEGGFEQGAASIKVGKEVLDRDSVERLLDTDSPVREWQIFRGLSKTVLV